VGDDALGLWLRQRLLQEPGAVPLDAYMDTIEKDVLIKALEQTRYNKTAAARLLGITFRALRYRLKKLGLE
jgi:two-component system response regulator PilR (NtrC family)